MLLSLYDFLLRLFLFPLFEEGRNPIEGEIEISATLKINLFYFWASELAVEIVPELEYVVFVLGLEFLRLLAGV